MAASLLQAAGLVLLGVACWLVAPPLGLGVVGAVLLAAGTVRELRS